MLPPGVSTRSARWPIAKDGSQPMPVSPGSSSRTSARCVARSSSSVVQRWPSEPTYCRSSSQIAQRAGGVADGACCVPHVTQT
jgi:hypothetical protein